MGNKQFDKGYEPHEVEKRWYEYWEKEQLFAAQDQSPQADVYAIRNSFHKMQKLTSMIQKNSNITAAVYTIRHDWLSKVF